jgi:hypothetical protein
MTTNENASPAAPIRRKLRALAAVLRDRATTEHERANAQGLKVRLEEQLKQQAIPDKPDATPDGRWAGTMFRLGRGIRETSTLSPNRNWTDHAFRLGKMVRRLLK